MPRNVEIKARVHQPERLRNAVEELADGEPEQLRQEDTFFECADGRLKLRGKVWMYLMKNRWWTDATLTTDANGMVTLRGFKGDYTVTFGKEDATGSTDLQLIEDQKSEVTLQTE